MSYQNWCVEEIVDILRNHRPETGSWNDIGYKSIITLLITHYADVYWSPNGWNQKNNGCQVNIWWDFNKDNFQRFFSPLLLSVKAKRLILGPWEDKNELKDQHSGGDLGEKIHFEHISPKSFLFKQLIQLPEDEVSPATVQAILRMNKIVVLTKQESRLLDALGMRFEPEDRDRLRELGLDPALLTREMTDANGLLENHGHPKNTGSAFLRMCRLNRLGVEFTYLGNDEVLPISRWHEYFDDTEFVLP